MKESLHTAALSLIGLMAGGAFFWFSFRSVSLADVFGQFDPRRALVLGPLLALAIVAFATCKALRWHALLGRPASIPPSRLIAPVFVGLLFNALVAHTGEVARSVAVRNAWQIPASAVLTSIAVERLFDFVAVLAFGLLAGMARTTSADLDFAMWTIVAVSAGALGLVALVLHRPGLLVAVATVLGAPLPPRSRAFLLEQVQHVLAGLEPLKDTRAVARVLAWSFAQWGLIVLCVVACAAVARTDVGVSAGALVLVLLVIAFALPSAPGYLGSTQFAFVAVLVPLGVTKEAALAASIVYTLAAVAPMMLIGAVLLPSVRWRSER